MDLNIGPSHDFFASAFAGARLAVEFSEGHFEMVLGFVFGEKRFFVFVNSLLPPPLPAAVDVVVGFLVLLWACEIFSGFPPSQVGQRNSATADCVAESVTAAITTVASKPGRLIFATPGRDLDWNVPPENRQECRKKARSLQGELKSARVSA